MKAFVAYDKTGRITALGVPNPEFGDDLVMEAGEDRSVVVVEIEQVVEGAEGLIFSTSDEAGKRLQEIVRTIAEGYRVDPKSQRLISEGR